MRVLDRMFGCLLFLGGIGHGLGSYVAYRNDHMVLLWAWSASLAVFLLAAVNLLRAGRNGDRSLGWISFVACLAWISFALWFGRLIGNVFTQGRWGMRSSRWYSQCSVCARCCARLPEGSVLKRKLICFCSGAECARVECGHFDGS